MNETTANTPIMENPDVKELLSIMRDNGKDTGGLLGLLGQVTSMESHLNKAVEELTAMRREISEMRDERDHPVRTHNAGGYIVRLRFIIPYDGFRRRRLCGYRRRKYFAAGGVCVRHPAL